MSEKRLYPKSAEKMGSLVERLEKKYQEEGYETQTMESAEKGQRGMLLQLRPQESVWQTVKDWTGLGMAATVTMTVIGEALEVEIGGGKWLDKAALTALSVVPIAVTTPLLLTASIGAWGQHSFLNRLLEEVEAYFREEVKPKCSKCGLKIPAGAKFCSECGEGVA